MILMQQKKIAALDEANARLVKELSRLGDKLERTTKLAAVARQGWIFEHCSNQDLLSVDRR